MRTHNIINFVGDFLISHYIILLFLSFEIYVALF